MTERFEFVLKCIDAFINKFKELRLTDLGLRFAMALGFVYNAFKAPEHIDHFHLVDYFFVGDAINRAAHICSQLPRNVQFPVGIDSYLFREIGERWTGKFDHEFIICRYPYKHTAYWGEARELLVASDYCP